MNSDDIYSKARREKPDFDSAIEQLANKHDSLSVITPLKNKDRAQEKAIILYDGDINRVDDILRASIIVTKNDIVTTVFDDAMTEFDVVRAVNKYTGKQHSSDGYFDARIYVNLNGFIAELQIHTKSMQAAKEKMHGLYEEKQKILRGTKPLTQEQRKAITDINKKMRDIFREASL